MLWVLGGLCWLAAIGCSIVILIDAFKNEVWKGIVSIVCGLYALYYAIVEFQNPNKGLIIFISIAGGIVGNLLFQNAAANVAAAGYTVR